MTYRPTWLIDTRDQCLTRCPKSGVTYIALSYVWGSSNFVTALKSNIEQLQVKNSLAPGKDQLPVPRTIRDAMYLVEILGDRYLWVDSLCIVQDDFTFKEREIDNMASIYANADITIVAGQGTDADSGLRGLRHCGTPQSRNLTQDIIQLRAFDILRRKPDLSGRSPWAGRAWNLQEFMLSRRVITFDEETVRWECDLNRWHEDRTVCHRVRGD